MKKESITLYLFYIISLSVIFFNGVDSSLLYQSAFLDNKTYSNFNYLHFLFSLLGGWFIGYFFTKRVVYQYKLSYILRISFLLSSISIFIQYQRHHFLPRDFEQVIFDNTLCSVVLGLMSYSMSRLFTEKNQLSYFKSHKFYWISITFIGFLYSQLITEKNIETAFILNGLIYFFAYIFFIFNDFEITHIMQETQKEKLFSYIFIGIMIISLILFSNLLIKITPIAEQSYMLWINGFFLLIEMTQKNKNFIKKGS